MISCKKTIFSSINECPSKWIINVYFSHLTKNYEKPYNAKKFQICPFLPLNVIGPLKFSQTHQTLNC